MKQPRTGSYASKEGASFSLAVNVKLETKFLIIMSMKSYEPNFLNTEVERSTFKSKERAIITRHRCCRRLLTRSLDITRRILLDAKLTSGSYFKIYGIAFCSYGFLTGVYLPCGAEISFFNNERNETPLHISSIISLQ